jgi:hypothetical protein
MARDATLERYLTIVKRMENYLKGFIVEHVKRAENTEADELAKPATRKAALQLDVFFQTIIAYLRHHYEPNNNIVLLRM